MFLSTVKRKQKCWWGSENGGEKSRNECFCNKSNVKQFLHMVHTHTHTHSEQNSYPSYSGRALGRYHTKPYTHTDADTYIHRKRPGVYRRSPHFARCSLALHWLLHLHSLQGIRKLLKAKKQPVLVNVLQAMMQQVGQGVSEGSAHRHNVCVNKK